MTIESQIVEFGKRQRLDGSRLLAGVSGGADSVALLRGLLAGQDELGWNVTVAHFDHGWRADSGADALWVRELCERLGVSCLCERATESAASEDAARRQRYAFLERAAAAAGCSFVAVAQTRDDQAETVLYQIARGSGLSGLAGISERRPLTSAIELVRPLLQATRQEVEDYLGSLGQDYRIDTTNSQRDYTRNRIRHELLPLLREVVNAGASDALVRLSGQARDVQSAMEAWAREVLERATLDQRPEIVRLSLEPLTDRPRALLREIIVQLWKRQNWPRQSLGFHHLDLLAEMMTTGDPKGCSLPGGIAASWRPGCLELRRLPDS